MPSRRKQKKGLHRMDAAYSALCPMGFPKTLVRKTISNLLKVYGGDDGWSFIEEASYKLVVDTILEEQEKAEEGNSEQKLADVSTSEVESVGQCDSPNTRSIQDKPLRNQFLLADSCENSFKSQFEKSPEETQSQNTISDAPMDTVPCQTKDSLKDKAAAEKCVQLMLPDVEYPPRSSGPAAGLPPIKKRKPCYGWISWEDEEEAAAYLNQPP